MHTSQPIEYFEDWIFRSPLIHRFFYNSTTLNLFYLGTDFIVYILVLLHPDNIVFQLFWNSMVTLWSIFLQYFEKVEYFPFCIITFVYSNFFLNFKMWFHFNLDVCRFVEGLIKNMSPYPLKGCSSIIWTTKFESIIGQQTTLLWFMFSKLFPFCGPLVGNVLKTLNY